MYLEKINSPSDLRALPPDVLDKVAAEIREEILDVVSTNGGHLGASLGTVELILALHYVFDTPREKILFDVGHQAYAHKLLTGRREFFHTLRQFGGCAGFPSRAEDPEADPLMEGHAGCAISAAVGMAAALQRKNSTDKVVAVVGDGSLNCGISLEGLNNARCGGKNLVVVLNDNKMSISKNVGGLSHYLNHIISGNAYNRFKAAVKRLVFSLPRHERLHRAIQRGEEWVKSLFLPPGVVFEMLGFRYIGPIHGHSMPELLRALGRAKASDEPLLIHVITEKGRGCDFARHDPARYHGVPGFDRETGRLPESARGGFSRTFGETMCELAEECPQLVAITAAMSAGTGLTKFAQLYSGRFYDVGIAEGHAVTFSAGLAAGGQRPVCAIYATFLQRALDCIYHDVVLPKLPVIFAIDRAGVVEDGPTHHGIFDLGFLRALPGLTILAPATEAELKEMLRWALHHDGPVAIRYPRGGSVHPDAAVAKLEFGRAEVVKSGEGSDVIWAMGPQLETALEVDRLLGGNNTVINARFLVPFDAELARRLAPGKRIVSIEDHTLRGGLGSALDEALCNAPHGEIIHFGWPDEIIPHGAPEKLRECFHLTAPEIAAQLRK